MAGITGLYANYPASFEYTSGFFLELTQLLESSINFNQQVSERYYGGDIDCVASGLRSADPRVNMRTGDLFTLFDTSGADVGLNGLCIEEAAQIPLIERDKCGAYKSPSVNAQHPLFSAPGGGFLWPERIIADQAADEGVVANLVFAPFWNGSSYSPLFMLPTNDISGISAPTFTSMYWPGPVRIANNQELDGILSWEVDTGIQFGTKIENGEPFPRVGAIRRREFMVRLRTVGIMSPKAHPQTTTPPTPNIWADDNVAKVANLLLSATGDTPSIDVYARKGVQCGTRVSDATAAHIKISCPVACARADDIQVSGTDDGIMTMTFKCIGAPTITNNVAIPAATPGVDST